MYEKAKSNVPVALTAEQQSDFFTYNISVRQRENLSPLLFFIYLHIAKMQRIKRHRKLTKRASS